MPHDPDEIEALNELDALLSGEDDLEARFRELERSADLGRAKARASQTKAEPPPKRPDHDDPLASLKAKVDGTARAAEMERVVLALCPQCGAKNRIPVARVATADPRCGACKAELVHERPRRR